MEQLDSTAHLSVGAQQVHVEVGPFVDEGRAADQTVDQACPLVGRCVGEKIVEVLGRRNASGQVEREATEEFVISGQRRIGNAIPLHLAKDMVVNKIATGKSAGRF